MRRAPPLLALAAAALAAAACSPAPEVGARPDEVLPADAAPAVDITGAQVVAGHVVVTYTLTDRGAPVTGAEATGLRPSWTLAWLDVEPVSGLRAWRSLLLTGSQTARRLPPAGPGTPAAQVLLDVKQPGTDSGGTTQELGGGVFTYTFADALPGTFDLAATLRAGVFLRGTPGTELTSATFDFVPAGGPAESYSPVLDDNCNACHGRISMHGGYRTGTKLCATCHTWQCTDPDTIDPAAMAGATKADYPNPLEMGRMIHRIHRGKNLPTLFLASSTATWPPDYLSSGATWPASPFTAPPPAPFRPGANAVAPAGTKYSVIGYQSSEVVFGRIASRESNFQPALTLAEGVAYPQDLRNCEACHAGAPDAEVIGRPASDPARVAISRRSCSGCHPDVFYGDPDDPGVTTPDAVHLAHTGGRQVDDAACRDCHVVERSGGPKLYAPIAEIHRPLNDRALAGSPRWSRVTGQIVGVSGMVAGGNPTVSFKVFDRGGSLSPLNAPTPANDTSPTDPSPLPRKITGLSLVASGPAADFITGGDAVLRGSPPLTSVDDGAGVFTYTFSTALPATAAGIWALGLEGRRQGSTQLYDAATDAFLWPYTGESITEYMSNEVVYVDLGTGTLSTSPAAARRPVVAQAKCERCHLELNLHGGNRHDVPHCLLCHAPDATDWDRRPRDTRTLADGGVVGSAAVLLHDPIDPAATTKRWGYATVDAVEERSVHFKVMIHRIHVGEREGVASLEGIRPFAIYGFASTTAAPRPIFFDDIRFPGDLGNCELCHLPDTWTIEAIPEGARPTTANERATILHAASFNADGTVKTAAKATHTSSSEPKVLPITATCVACHTSGAATDHAAARTVGGVEQCGSCHGEKGAYSVRRSHAVP